MIIRPQERAGRRSGSTFAPWASTRTCQPGQLRRLLGFLARPVGSRAPPREGDRGRSEIRRPDVEDGSQAGGYRTRGAESDGDCLSTRGRRRLTPMRAGEPGHRATTFERHADLVLFDDRGTLSEWKGSRESPSIQRFAAVSRAFVAFESRYRSCCGIWQADKRRNRS